MENKVHRTSRTSNKSSNRESLHVEKEELDFKYITLEPPTLNYLENPLNSGFEDFEIINLKIQNRKENNFKFNFDEISKSKNCFELNKKEDFYVGDNILILFGIINILNNQVNYKEIFIYDENDKKRRLNFKHGNFPYNNILDINDGLYFSISLKNIKEELKIGIKFDYRNVIIKKNHYEIINDNFFEKKISI